MSCPICLYPISDSIAKVDACGHLFCYECLLNCLVLSVACPVCQRVMFGVQVNDKGRVDYLQVMRSNQRRVVEEQLDFGAAKGTLNVTHLHQLQPTTLLTYHRFFQVVRREACLLRNDLRSSQRGVDSQTGYWKTERRGNMIGKRIDKTEDMIAEVTRNLVVLERVLLSRGVVFGQQTNPWSE